jgi:hypothetical protein
LELLRTKEGALLDVQRLFRQAPTHHPIGAFPDVSRTVDLASGQPVQAYVRITPKEKKFHERVRGNFIAVFLGDVKRDSMLVCPGQALIRVEGIYIAKLLEPVILHVSFAIELLGAFLRTLFLIPGKRLSFGCP